ncbi:hypothetical protein [Massilia rhizosphaerae]|uniref:hypothetical protein n=1 Tax=Massilia rhizosphaerae TaxID=2784389 RepID=UPI0018DB07F7|nr:hypothetical protein [Massilia rhizosphaerae]
MTAKDEYERMGKFIYGACRHGGNVADVHNWMADDLGVARPDMSEDTVPAGLYTAFFSKYVSDDEFQANFERFVETLKARNA